MNPKLPFHRSDRYTLLLVPEDHRQVRKIRLSAGQIRAGIIVVALLAAVGLLNVTGFIYYRSLYLGFEKERRINEEFAEDRVKTLKDLEGLEATVTAAEKYANNLATLVGMERPELRKGIGAVRSKVDLLQQAESLNWQDVGEKVSTLQDRAKVLELRVEELNQIQQNKLLYIASKPSIWPVKGWVTSEFGYRRSPLTNEQDFHAGLDVASHWGTTIVSPGAGVVVFAGYKGGLGRAVIVDHGYGIRSYYGHASSLLVAQGDVVTRGTQIARVGNSGHSTGPHLHYEIHIDGVPVDPMKYILQ